MVRVVAIGECMVEIARPEGAPPRLGFAGDTYNTAWYLRRCLPDVDAVDYLTALGDDPVSEEMLGAMRAAGVGTGHVRRIPGRVPGLYMIHTERGERSFTYWRETSAARCLADDPAALAAALEGAGWVYVSGITMAILSPEARARLLAALGAARASGACIAFDPNLRPRLWEDAGTLRRVVTETAGLAALVLPSFDDEAAAFGDADPGATAARYAAAGAEVVVVKTGGGPVVTLDRGGRGKVGCEAVAPVDTTGAGDSFNAGLLAALIGGAGLEAAVRAGHAVAAQVVRQPGALVPVTV